LEVVPVPKANKGIFLPSFKVRVLTILRAIEVVAWIVRSLSSGAGMDGMQKKGKKVSK
jgi:hypothetical protein